MVYCGLENTYTPGHTDICGSLGHNLMVASDPEAYALWFIAESKDKAKGTPLTSSPNFWVLHPFVKNGSHLNPPRAFPEHNCAVVFPFSVFLSAVFGTVKHS